MPRRVHAPIDSRAAPAWSRRGVLALGAAWLSARADDEQPVIVNQAVPGVLAKLKGTFRYLLQSKLNTSRALSAIEKDPGLTAREVRSLVEFIRTSRRGVILRRPTRRAEELVAEE